MFLTLPNPSTGSSISCKDDLADLLGHQSVDTSSPVSNEDAFFSTIIKHLALFLENMFVDLAAIDSEDGNLRLRIVPQLLRGRFLGTSVEVLDESGSQHSLRSEILGELRVLEQSTFHVHQSWFQTSSQKVL